MAHPHNSGSALRTSSNFSEWKGLWGNLIFLYHFLLFDWAWLRLSQATVAIRSLNSQDMTSFMITTGSLNSQDMISQVEIYVVDIVWILCDVYMWGVKIQQRVIWFCKVSLRNCYVSLFECKGPWMLKTDSLIF